MEASPSTSYHPNDHPFSSSPSISSKIDVNNDHEASPSGVNDMKERLSSARKTVQEYTETALRAASSGMTLPGINLDQFCSSTSNQPVEMQRDPHDMWLHPPTTSKELLERGISIFEENDFHAGMEHMIHDRLTQVESDLLEIVKFHSRNSNLERESAQMEDSKNHHEQEKGNDDDFMDIDNLQLDDNENDTLVQNVPKEELQQLVFKVRFLRKCAKARNKLDECSFTNDIVYSAKCLEEAENLHKECHDMVQSHSPDPVQHYLQQGVEDNSKSLSPSTPLQKSIRRDLQVSNHILGSIYSQIIRQRSSVHSKASSIFDNCVSIQSNKIIIQNPLVKSGANSIGSIEAAFEVFRTLSKHNENALTDVICILSSQLYQNVLLKLLQKQDPKHKFLSSKTVSSTDPKKSFPRWKFQEYASEDTSTISDPQEVSIRTTTLEWKSESTTNETNENKNSNDLATTFIEPWTHILKSITTILDFIHKNILLGRTELCAMMGDILFTGDLAKSPKFLGSITSLESLASMNLAPDAEMDGPLMKKLLDINWDYFVPSSPLGVKDIGTLLLQASETFESNIVCKGYISQFWLNSQQQKDDKIDSNDKLLPLSNFASVLEQKIGEKKRSKILVQGRAILLKEDFHNTTIVGTDPDASPHEQQSIPTLERIMEKDGQAVFLLHKCSISKVASSIMSLARKTLDESISLESLVSTGPHLYRAARELFDLFRAIIPTLHGTAISTIPRAAAILHNDCMYFAHEMLTLGHEYREQYPPESHVVLKKMCTFVDFVPIFREMGDRILVEMIERQKSQLATLVYERVCGLRNGIRMNEEVVEWSEAETGVRAANYHLRHLSTAWVNILSRDVYGRSMGNLVDTLLTILLDQVMGATDISAAASHFVGVLFADAMKTREIFHGKEDEAKKYCSLWEKFHVVSKFMDMSLVNINAALSEGYFRSVTGPELSRLIKAAFDDSEKRRSILSALANE